MVRVTVLAVKVPDKCDCGVKMEKKKKKSEKTDDKGNLGWVGEFKREL